MPRTKGCDMLVVGGAVLAFTLPLSLLMPDFSVWDWVPKVHVTRLPLFTQYLTWSQLNTAVIALLSMFFCLYLEMRKRRLDEMVERVILVTQVADRTVDIEMEKNTTAKRACAELLDASADHYENLVLLRDDLRRRECLAKQHPPIIESSEISWTNNLRPLAVKDCK